MLLGLDTGCASSSAAAGAKQQTAPPLPAVSDAERPVSGYHTTATALARHITACKPALLTLRTAAQRLHLRTARDLSSAASCTLRGRTVVVLTFTGRAEQDAVDAELRGLVAYYATGPCWSAAPTDTSEPVGQQSAVQDVALALGGLVEAGRG